MQFGTCKDEVKLYLDARFVSSCEGIWRLLMFEMHHEIPNVVRLQVHLPGQQYVTWNPERQPNIQEVVERVAEKDTTLTAYFKANVQYENARQLYYHEIPQKFVWMDSKKKWQLRKKGFAIGRMYFTSPKAGEKFYLCTLLNGVKVCHF